ncbi:MAG: cytochrome c oxidase subunit II [Rhodospirillales bacterium]|jgi:cytochrome c oxidase subunit 2|nr:cytochrome c oxidase subunit II [Rhodospirillales bacterium]
MKKNSDLLSKLLQKFSSMLPWSVALICMPLIQTSYASEPQPWQWNFQPPATPVMEQIIDFHNLMFFVEVGIVLLVLGLMVYIVVKFNSKANPKPTKTTHNTTLEVLWTVIPIVILIIFAVPSMKLLFFMEKAQNPEMTLKVTGNQWYWSYQYPDNGNFEFDSNIIPDEDIKPGQRRLLEVDNQVVLPVNTEIKVLLTARDVMHNWAVPAFGIKIDTIPGRINETWMKVTKIGTYYGQCSELCGVAHSRMPISVKVVSKEDFKKWLKKAKSEFASSDNNKMLKLAQLKK